jgi:hypothetical protein
MSDSGDSPARRLVAAIDDLIVFVAENNMHAGRPPIYLDDAGCSKLFALEGNVISLHRDVAGGNLPFQSQPSKVDAHSSYTPNTGIEYFDTRIGIGIHYMPEWDIKMKSLRAAAQAVEDAERSAVATNNDSPKDKPKKTRKVAKRGPRNATEFMKFKAAIDKAERRGQQKADAALEFTNGNEKKANALLRQFYRHKDLPK